MQNSNLIKKAIEKGVTINFNYNNVNTTVEPYHMGNFGQVTQLHGYKKTGMEIYDGWRNFHIEKMEGIKLNQNHRFNIRDSYNPTGAKYSTIEVTISYIDSGSEFKP